MNGLPNALVGLMDGKPTRATESLDSGKQIKIAEIFRQVDRGVYTKATEL